MGSRRFTSGIHAYPITVDNAAAIYWGSPVALIAGGIKIIAATPTTTGSANSPVGVINWFQWEDATGVKIQRFLPASVITGLGGKKVWAGIHDDPDTVWMVQASATLDNTAIGKNAALLNVNQGNLATGRSKAALDAASAATTATLAVRIVRVLQPGDPFPDVLVQFNGGVHQYDNNFAV